MRNSTLEGFFEIFDAFCASDAGFEAYPDISVFSDDLFAEPARPVSWETTLALAAMRKIPEGASGELYGVSAAAYEVFIKVWMSRLPVETPLFRFGRAVLTAARRVGIRSPEARTAASRAFSAADPNITRIAGRVQHEIHRITGFLRFAPTDEGWIARCGPDYFILPALARHFSLRFGDESWAIIDETRRLILRRFRGQEPQLVQASKETAPACPDSWERLWERYHQSVSNETRRNPELQSRFMPARYRKYLPEMS
jgi:hypothetical protein